MDREQQLRLECLRIVSHPDKQVGQMLTEADRLYRYILEGNTNGTGN